MLICTLSFQHKIAFPDNWTDEGQLESQTIVASQQSGVPGPDHSPSATFQDQDPIHYQGRRQQYLESDTYQTQEFHTSSIQESQYDINDQPSSSTSQEPHHRGLCDQPALSQQTMLYGSQGQVSYQ